MEVNKIVCIKNNSVAQWCCYLRDWNGIPVFLTGEGREARSALYKDGTSFFIMGGDLLRTCNESLIYNRLWHEVAHLFFQDVWKPWNILFEYRADLVASAATSRNQTLNRLYALKKAASDKGSTELIEKRLENLYSAQNTYTKESVLYMLSCLKPVTVLK